MQVYRDCFGPAARGFTGYWEVRGQTGFRGRWRVAKLRYYGRRGPHVDFGGVGGRPGGSVFRSARIPFWLVPLERLRLSNAYSWK